MTLSWPHMGQNWPCLLIDYELLTASNNSGKWYMRALHVLHNRIRVLFSIYLWRCVGNIVVPFSDSNRVAIAPSTKPTDGITKDGIIKADREQARGHLAHARPPCKCEGERSVVSSRTIEVHHCQRNRRLSEEYMFSLQKLNCDGTAWGRFIISVFISRKKCIVCLDYSMWKVTECSCLWRVKKGGKELSSVFTKSRLS